MKLTSVAIFSLFLLMGSLGIGHAQTHSYGSWVEGTQSGGGGLYAATINDSGNVFGQYCFTGQGSCVYILGMDTSCNEGDRYPVLINASEGAVSTEVLCGGLLEVGKYQYILTNFKLIDGTIKKSDRIGFAVPLKYDRFIVVRFDLNGSNQAIAVMRALVEQSQSTQPHQSTRDQTF